jgi:hypothetical protein
MMMIHFSYSALVSGCFWLVAWGCIAMVSDTDLPRAMMIPGFSHVSVLTYDACRLLFLATSLTLFHPRVKGIQHSGARALVE